MDYRKALQARSWTLTSRTGLVLSVTCDPDSPVFRAFFAEYDKAFVLPAEKEEESGFRDCLALNHGPLHDGLEGQYGPFVEIVLTARAPDGTGMIGGLNLIAMQYQVAGDTVITSNLNYIFTTTEGRGRGYFPQLLDIAAEVVGQLFPSPGNERPLIFVEQNDPFKMSAEAYAADTAHTGIDQFDRLLKWARAGARVLDLNYIQPALSADQPADRSLAYTVLNAPSSTIDAEIVAAHLKRFFALSVAKGRPAIDPQSVEVQLADLADRTARGQPVIVQDPLPFLLERPHSPIDPSDDFPTSLSSALPRILSGYSRTVEPSLHWTLSLHIDNEALGHLGRQEQTVGDKTLFDQLGGVFLSEQPTETSKWNPDLRLARQRENQSHFPTSAELRDAMEPMFNDIADRERLGIVEDYMLAIAAKADNPSATDREVVTFMLDPSKIAWQTEGIKYRAELADLPPQQVEMRRLWYVHRNCSVSYHVSFRIVGYDRTPAFFFFLSMLQKLVSPKEFLLPDAPDILIGAHPALTPFEAIRVVSQRGDLDFWHFMAGLFDRDFGDFSARLTQTAVTPYPISPWQTLTLEPYVEVPGLKMPHLRSMFYFADSVFRDLLLPRNDDGAPTKRVKMLSETFFNDELAEVLARQDQDREGSGARHPATRSAVFRLEFWDWLSRNHLKAIAPEWHKDNPEAFASLQRRTAYGGIGDNRGSVALSYLFLAGFTQNIIDFVNQDASEVLDSLDPLYPSAEDDLEEGFFVRYANPRTMFNFTARMRSLETGADYIGTCPYAFLIHVLTLHNEFLTRDFEKRAALVLNKAEELASSTNLRNAADCFYDFRRTYVAEYDIYKYSNVFRYDTEGKIFAELNRIRGVELKHAYISQLINAAEKRTADYEERARQEGERNLSKNLAVVALFSVIGVVLQFASQLKDGAPIQDWAFIAHILFWVCVACAIVYITAASRFMVEPFAKVLEPFEKMFIPFHKLVRSARKILKPFGGPF